jgi:alcohol dehydrogenase class IV
MDITKVFSIRNFYKSTKIIYGLGSISNIGIEVKNLNAKKVLVVTDKGIVGAGVYDKIKNILNDNNINLLLYDEVKANPVIANVKDGFALFKQNNPDIIIGLGGGSSIDTAKAIGILTSNQGELSEYEFEKYFYPHKEVKPRAVPLITIPTTAGTGSEITQVSLIYDPKKKYKMLFCGKNINPDLAFIDPLLTLSLPPRATASTGIDALIHAIESYVSKGAWELTETIAIRAIELIGLNLREAVGNGDNILARDNMMKASMLAGLVFDQTGCGMVHGMGHPICNFYGAAHGETMGILLPYIMSFNLITSPVKFAKIAKALGENIDGLSVMEAANKAVYAVNKLVHDVNMPTLKQMGVKEENIEDFANWVINDLGDMKDNPRTMTKEDIVNIYTKGLRNELPLC